MNSPFRVAQVSQADSQPTRVITITKPSNGEAVVVNLSHDGKVKLDLSAIANEKITIVKVPSGEPGGAEKAVILFDNQSTITIDPFFFGGQFPLNLTVDLNAQHHDLTPGDFASLFTVTDDQSILPAGGDGSPSSGAEFSNPSVDPLAPSNPLALLGPEELPNWTRTTDLTNPLVDDTPTFDAGQSFLLDEDALTSPPAARAGNNDNAPGDDPGDQSFAGVLHYDFKHDGPAGTDPIMVDVSSLNGTPGNPVYTSGGKPITFTWDPTTFTLTGTVDDGQGNLTTIITLQVNPATATAAGNDHPFTLEITGPFDHPGHDDPNTPQTETSFEDNIVLHLNFLLTDSNGTVTPGVVDINIDDDSPVLTQQPAQKLTVDEDDIATPWSIGTSPDTNSEGPGDQSVTQGGGGFVHPAIVTGSVAGLVAFGADGEKSFGLSADAVSYFQSLNLFSKHINDPENGIALDYVIIQDAANHTTTLRGYEPDTPAPGLSGNPVFDFVLDTQTGNFVFKLYDELIHTPGDGENTDLRSGGPGLYDTDNNGVTDTVVTTGTTSSIPYLDFGHVITATDGDGDTIALDGKVQITVKDDVPEVYISASRLGFVQHDESAGVQTPTFGDPDNDTPSIQVRNRFFSLESNHAGELGKDTDVSHTPANGPAIGYAHSAISVVNASYDIGADSPAKSATLSLQLIQNGQDVQGVYSGVQTTDGHNIYLYSVDGYIVGRVGLDSDATADQPSPIGKIAFAITIEQGGNIDVAQYLSLHHPDTSSNDETISLNDSAIQAVLTVVDSDGDEVSASTDIGSHIRFDDDGPKLVGGIKVYTADEDDILVLTQSVGSHPNDGDGLDGSFTGSPADNILGPAYLSGSLAGSVDFGADGGPGAGGGFSFADDALTAMAGYGLSSKGDTLSYTLVGDTLVAYVERVDASRYNPLADRTVFTLHLDNDGQFEFKLYDQLDHVYGDNGENTQLAGSNGAVDGLHFGSLILATDGDGDSVAMFGKLMIKITDDVPHIVSFNETGAGVTIDETGGNNNNNVTGLGLLLVVPQFSGVQNIGHDGDMNGGNPVYAANISPLVTGAYLSGADDSASAQISLVIKGYTGSNLVDSGLTTTAGDKIYLTIDANGMIVGRIDGDNNGQIDGLNPSGDDVAAFAININQLGQLSIAQYLSLHHGNPNDADDGKSVLSDDLIQVRYTVTDYDGDQDSQTVGIGSAIRFDDDGPKVLSNNAVALDDDLLSGNPGIAGNPTDGAGSDDVASSGAPQNVTGTLGHDYGSDGAGSVSLLGAILPNGTFSVLPTDGTTLVIQQLQDGNQVDVLRITITDAASGAYKVEQLHALDHPNGNNENNLSFTVNYRVTDGDGDHVDTGRLGINVDDDTPIVATGTVTDGVDEDALTGHDADTNPLRPGEVDGTPLTAVATGNLGALFSPGADTPLHYSLLNSNAAINTLINQHVKSGGVELSYSVSGDTLTGYLNTNATPGYQSGQDTPVFTLQIAADGTYTFTLLNELDHPKLDGQGNGNNENTLSINFGGLVHAADHDNDPVNASGPAVFQITVLDDIPSITLTNGSLIADGNFAGGNGDFPNNVGAWASGSGSDPDGISGWAVTASNVNPATPVQLERVGDGYLGMHTSTLGAMIDMAASPGNIAIAQTVTGNSGQTYAIQFEAGAPFPSTATLEIYWGGQLIGTIHPEGPMTSYNYVVTADGTPQTLEFREIGANDNHGTYLANVAMIPAGIVDEDGLNPNGNHDLPMPSTGDALVPDTDSDNNEATATGSLNITWGVDDTNGGVDGAAADSGFVQDGAGGAALTGRSVYFTDNSVGVSGGIPLTSHGDAVTFVLSQNNTVLTGMAGGREIFSVSLSDDGSGAYRFVLKGQLDHAPNGDENDITLTFNFSAKDFDGDAVNGHFAVGIDDDMPVILANNNQTVQREWTLDEDMLPAAGHTSPQGNDAYDTPPDFNDYTLIDNKPLGVLWGADGPGTLAFIATDAQHPVITVTDQNGAPLSGPLTSGHVALSYGIVSNPDGTQTLTAYKGDPVNNDIVFKLTLDPDATPTGGFTFELIGSLDHTDGNGENLLNLSFGFTATDGDNDPASSNILIRIQDDVPVEVISAAAKGIVEEEALPTGNEDTDADADTSTNLNVVNASVTLDISGLVKAGADGLAGFALTAAGLATLPALTSDHAQVHYEISGNTLTAFVDVGAQNGAYDAGDRPVFTLELTDPAAGTAVFTLLGQLDHTPPAPGTGVENTLDIDFGGIIEATDGDGDPVTLTAGNVIVTVIDDIPVVDSSAHAGGVIAEHDIGNAAATITVALNSLVLPGADGPLTFSLKDVTALGAGGTPLAVVARDHLGDTIALTSHGFPVLFTGFDNSVAGETKLTATANGQPVFTLTVTEGGTATITLFQPLDHPFQDDPATVPAEISFGDGIFLDFSSLLNVVDADGDSPVKSIDSSANAPIPGEVVEIAPANFTGDGAGTGLALNLRNFMATASGGFDFTKIGAHVNDVNDTTIVWKTLAGDFAQAHKGDIQYGSQTTLTGDNGNDILIAGGSSNQDDLIGGGGDDLLINLGSGASDDVNGGAGNDTAILAGDVGRMQGGDGLDQAFVVNSSTLTAGGITGFERIEILPAAANGDGVIQNRDNALTLDFSATTLVNINRINGGANADNIYTAAKHENVGGGTVLYDGDNPNNPNVFGADRINVTIGAEDFAGSTLTTGLIADLKAFATYSGAATFTFNALSLSLQHFENFYVNWQTMDGQFAQAQNNAFLFAGNGATVNGGNVNEVLVTNGNNREFLNGGDGDDLLVGLNGGFDELNGDGGNDTFVSIGSDTRIYRGGSGDDQILQVGTSVLSIQSISGIEKIEIETGNGTIRGNGSANQYDFRGVEFAGVSRYEEAGSGVNFSRVITESKGDFVTYAGSPSGLDLITIQLTDAQRADPTVQAEIAAFFAGGHPANFTFSSLNLAIDSYERVVFQDGAGHTYDPNNPGSFFSGVHSYFDDGQFVVEVVDDVPGLTVGAGDQPQAIAAALDETVRPNYTSDPAFDRYAAGENESAPGTPNGGADDHGAGPLYNHTPVISLNPAAAQAIGSFTTAAGVIGSQFDVHAILGADGAGSVSQHLSLALSGTSVATLLVATNTGAPELAAFGADPSRAISLFKVSDTVIEGRLAGDPNTANDDYVAFRITLNNASDPANASITVDQFMAIQHGDDTTFDENAILKLVQGSLDLKLDVVATDYDHDTVEKSFTVNLADTNGSFVSFDDDGPAVKGVTLNDTLGNELVLNGSFENGVPAITNGQGWVLAFNIDNWTSGGDNRPFEIQQGGTGGLGAQQGQFKVELDSDTDAPNTTGHTNSTIQQTIATEAGETYQLSFWYAPRGDAGVNSSGLDVYFGGAKVYEIPSVPNPPATWQLITIQVTATDASSVLAFQATGGENEYGAFLDNVSLKQIIPLDDEQTSPLGLANGPGDDGNGVVAHGKIDFDAGTDGLRSIKFNDVNGLKAIHVDAGGIGTQETVTTHWVSDNAGGGTLFGNSASYPDANPVFTLVVDSSGNYTFTLNAPLAHDAPPAGTSFENNLLLDLGFVVTDGDGDHAAGTVVINVDDDSPNALAGDFNAGEVYEDGLKTPGDLSNGNAEPPALQPVSVLITSAALTGFVAAGADGLKSFGLNTGAAGTVHTSAGADVKSDGVAVTYAFDAGTGDVLGMAGNREVFRLHDNGDGTFSFTLNDQIDHIPNVPADNDSQVLDINIVSAFTATDGDGDTVALDLGSLNITVEDDIPFFAGDPYTLSVTQTGTVFSGSVDFHVGADEPGQFSITPPALDGVTTQTSTDPQTGIVTVTGTFTDGGDPYYVFTFNPATGGYTFDLASLPTSTTPLADVNVRGGFGPTPDKDYGPFVIAAQPGHNINGSGDGIGVDTNGIGAGESLVIKFDHEMSAADLQFKQTGSETVTVTWKAYDSQDPSHFETGTFTIPQSEAGSTTYTADVLSNASNVISQFDRLELSVSSPGNSGEVKLRTVGGDEITAGQNPPAFVFNVSGSDYDGDSAAAAVTITFDALNTLPSAGTESVTIDEDGLPYGITDTAQAGDIPGAQITQSGTLPHGFNTDGPAASNAIAFAASGAVLDSGGNAVKSNGAALSYFWDSANHILYGTTDTSGAPAAALHAAFSISLDQASGVYTYTQLAPLTHPAHDENGANDGPEHEYEDNIVLNIGYTVTDSNNDQAPGTLTITVNDDSPQAAPDEGSVTKGALLAVDAAHGVLANDHVGADVLDGTPLALGGQHNITATDVPGPAGWGSNPVIAAFPGGGYVVSWYGYGTADNFNYFSGIWAQRFNADGSHNDPVLVATNTTGNPSSVATLADGSFVVSWVGRDSSFNYFQIYSEHFNAGDVSGGAVVVSPLLIGIYGNPVITALDGGGYAVAWGQYGDGGDISVQRLDASGQPIGGTVLVETGDQLAPAIAGLAGGGFVVTWYGSGAEGNGVYAERFAADGTPAGAFHVNTDPAEANEGYYPAVAALADGGFVVTWYSSGIGGDSSYGIHGQRYDASGAPVNSEFLVNTYTASDQFNSSVTGLSDGGFVVTWVSYGQDADGSIGVYGQRFDASGDKVGSEFPVNQITDNSQYQTSGHYTISQLADGDLVAVWYSYGSDATNGSPDVFYRQFSLDGNQEIVGVRAEGGDVTSPVTGGVDTAIDGLYGVLTLHADGSYSYQSDAGKVLPAGAVDKFVYTITDADGDLSTTTLSVAVTDSTPQLPVPHNDGILTNEGPWVNGGVVQIPIAALLANDGVSYDSHVTIGTVTGATINNGFVEIAVPSLSTVSFTYTLTDGTGTSGPATVSVTRVDPNQKLDGDANDNFFVVREWSEDVYGGDGNDVIAKINSTVHGGAGDDHLFGIGGGNELHGDAGNDVLYGQWNPGQSSILDGGADNDVLVAGNYNGSTTMTGGTGNDTFVFLGYTIAPDPNAGAASTITDYVFGQDKVDLTGLLESIYGTGNATIADVRVTADPHNASNAAVQIDVNTGVGQTWQSVVSLTDYNHAGNQVNVVLDHMTNQQHNYPVA